MKDCFCKTEKEIENNEQKYFSFFNFYFVCLNNNEFYLYSFVNSFLIL